MERIRLGPGGEFDLIRRLLAQDAAIRERIGGEAPGLEAVLVGTGDDCTVVHGAGIAVSVDLSIEDVHFRRPWIEPEEIGWRATAASLSDLAAVAARPLGVLVSLALPPTDRDGERVMAGVSEAAARHGALLLGGDVARSPGPLVIDVAAIGQTGAPVLRSGARPGDEIWVTGRLGAAAAAVRTWEAGGMAEPAARAAFARPHARIPEARWLAERGALHALIDLSDGLAGDAGHLASASGVRILLELDHVPVHEAALRATGTRREALALALGGGEDYELCFAAPGGAGAALAGEFRMRFGLELTRVGTAAEGEGIFGREGGGEPRPLALRGFSHFQGGDPAAP
jgi:thiamine-monophosphate kinase